MNIEHNWLSVLMGIYYLKSRTIGSRDDAPSKMLTAKFNVAGSINTRVPHAEDALLVSADRHHRLSDAPNDKHVGIREVLMK